MRALAAMGAVAAAVLILLGLRAAGLLGPEGSTPSTSVAVDRPAAPVEPVTVPVAGGTPDLLPVAPPERARIREKALAEARALAERTGSTALLVWRDGALQLEYYGRGTKPSDRLNGADLQQALVPLLAGVALRDGVFRSIDQPLSDLLLEWGQDPRGRITLRQLLQGTSGLSDQAPGQAPGQAGDPLQAASLAPPGEHALPSETELRLVVLALERASGRSFAELLSAWLWLPMGGQDAQLAGPPRAATPGQGTGQGAAPPDCCLAATARDWLRIGLLIEGRGRRGKDEVVPGSWIDAMVAPGEPNPNLAMHVWLAWPHRPEAAGFRSDEAFLLPDTLFLAGEGGQRLYVSRSANLVILRLGAAQPDWDESVLPNLIARGLINPPPEAVTPHVPKGGVAEMPPVIALPKRPKVEAVPLDPPPGPPPEPPVASGSSGP